MSPHLFLHPPVWPVTGKLCVKFKFTRLQERLRVGRRRSPWCPSGAENAPLNAAGDSEFDRLVNWGQLSDLPMAKLHPLRSCHVVFE